MPDDDTPSLDMDSVRASRLIYAKPQDLPSFPSVGLNKNGAAASAAATLGWANQKSPELWKPDSSASASAAAVLAKNYKMAPTWEPQASSHGAKAALLAAQGAKPTETWKPTASSHGQSAATLAFNSNASIPRYIQTDDMQHHGSLHAAHGAMASRQRAISTPSPRPDYPDKANAASNALAAARGAHKPNGTNSATPVGGAVPYTNMNRQMFTSNPPVKTETPADQNRADVLHASAIAMAKKMYSQQQKTVEARLAKAETSSFREGDSDDEEPQPMVFNSLQEAAYRQAQARLAKIHEDNKKRSGNRESQEYYGVSSGPRKGTIRDRLRRRASSDGALTEDNLRSQQIRHEMSVFSKTLQTVDDKKRQKDQEALLAAAHRNVQARLKTMDAKISAETGMAQPSSNWESKAHATALLRSQGRTEHQGKVDVGAGLRMDQDAIDAIAARRVQPVLDDINEKAAKEHARQTELRLEQERKKEELELEKARKKEVDDINKKLKEQDKREQRERKAEEKQEAKARKEEQRAKHEEEKAARAEQKRLSRAEKQQIPTGTTDQPVAEPEASSPTSIVALNSSGQPVHIPQSPTEEPQSNEGERSPESPKSPSEKSRGRVRSWFKSRFAKNESKSPEKGKDRSNKAFVGGAALTGMEGNDSTVSLDNRSASMHAVAMAGRSNTAESEHDDDAPEPVSPLSSSSDEEVFRDAPSEPIGLMTPRPLRERGSMDGHSPDRTSKFHEII